MATRIEGSLEDGGTVHELVRASRLLPVVVVDDPRSGAPLADALVDGGLGMAEVTFRTAGAVDALEAMAAHPGLCVGAGTVVNVAQVDRAVGAGAQFVVSPGLSGSVVRRCQELSIPVFPGVATATDITSATDLGVDVMKFFPAEQLGGPAMISALAAPFPRTRFIPTGGITAERAPAYLAHPAVLAIGGSWMVAPDLVRRGKWDQVTRLTREAVAIVESVEDDT